MGVIVQFCLRHLFSFLVLFALGFVIWLAGHAGHGAWREMQEDIQRFEERLAERERALRDAEEVRASIERLESTRQAAEQARRDLEAQQARAVDELRGTSSNARRAQSRLLEISEEMNERREAFAEQVRGPQELLAAAVDAQSQAQARLRAASSALCDPEWWRVIRRLTTRRACARAQEQYDRAQAELARMSGNAARARQVYQQRIEEGGAELTAWVEARQEEQTILSETLNELGAANEAARSHADALEAHMREVSASVESLGRELADEEVRRELIQTQVSALESEIERLEEARSKSLFFVAYEFRRAWFPLMLIVLAILLAPLIHRTLAYYAFMPSVERARGLRLRDQSMPGSLKTTRADRTIEVSLAPDETIYARSSDIRPVTERRGRTQLLYDWKAPLVSLSAELRILTRVAGEESATRPIMVTLSPSGDAAADSYVMRIDLHNHPGLVLRPRHVMAILARHEVDSRGRSVPTIRVERSWALTRMHAWATGQVRFIMFSGTGSIFIEGVGDIAEQELQGEAKQERHGSIVGFDSRLLYTTRRTETFVPYLFGMKPLVEVGLEGDGHLIWQKVDSVEQRGLIERTLGAGFSVVGKLLGF